MVDKIKKISSKAIIVFTALALIALFVAKGLFGFLTESSSVKNGSLQQYTLASTDFVWNGIEVRNGVVVSTDNDPQMILDGTQKFTSLRFYMESSIYPGEMVVYYTEPGDAGFSTIKRLWAVPADQPDWYVVETSMKDVTALRLDPTMYAGNVLEFGDFIFNESKSFSDYFEISYGEVFNLILYTGIISSVLKFLQEIIKREID